jgi:Gpi18-like mannosyltransferase
MSGQILVTTQPAATVEPTVEQVAETVHDSVTSVATKDQSASESLPLLTLGIQQNATPQQRQRKPSSFRYGFLRFLRIVNKIFSGLVHVFVILLAGIGVAILVAYVVAVVSPSRFNPLNTGWWWVYPMAVQQPMVQ